MLNIEIIHVKTLNADRRKAKFVLFLFSIWSKIRRIQHSFQQFPCRRTWADVCREIVLTVVNV